MPRFHIVSLFPELFSSFLSQGLMERALKKGLVSVDIVDPRQWSTDRHRHVDDRPYGGGPGMVIGLEPLVGALRSLPAPGRMLAMAPNGRPATQKLVRSLAREEDITLVCGRYEGFDARVYDLFPLEPVCVGDIVLNGGEVAALALVEAVSRLVPGFMGKEASGDEESFSAGLLEYPHYTRPEVYEGLDVPQVLLEGDHARIAAWRRELALETTLARRPDLLEGVPLDLGDARVLAGALSGRREGAPGGHLPGRLPGEPKADAPCASANTLGDAPKTSSLARRLTLVLVDNSSDKNAPWARSVYRPFGLFGPQGQAAGGPLTCSSSGSSESPLSDPPAGLGDLVSFFGLKGLRVARSLAAPGAGMSAGLVSAGSSSAEQSPEDSGTDNMSGGGADGTPDLARCLASLREEAEALGETLTVLALGPLDAKKRALGTGSLRGLLEEGPVALVLGSQGYVSKRDLALCDGRLRPVRCLDSAHVNEAPRTRVAAARRRGSLLDCRTHVALLLDRVFGDWF